MLPAERSSMKEYIYIYIYYTSKYILYTPEYYIYTRRFAPRAAYAARYACSALAQEGNIDSVKRTKKGPCLIVSQSANWRLENAKNPAAMLQENNPQTPHA